MVAQLIPKPFRRRFLCVAAIAGLISAQAQVQRVPNTTLQMPPSPPVLGYTLTNAFGTLAFTDPVVITTPPGETNRLFIAEQDGRIIVMTNLASPNRTVFLDIVARVSGGVPTDERGLLGLAFHPGYATNGWFYVFYTGADTTPVPGGTNSLHDILSRVEVSAGNSNQANASSELKLLRQRDEANNHNAGDLHFGPDGYLYVSLGDEGNANDTFNNSQVITKDFFAGILRLDIDKRPGSLPPNPHPAAPTHYAIPPDNPFIGATSFNGATINPASIRTEFWAVGLRNPWRFSFDPLTGVLYCADVGQNQYEEINIVSRGGNYGWAFREGLHNGPKFASTPPGFSHINPIQEYTHGSGTNQGFSVTGGLVYRGTRLSQLYGYYVFADYVSGNVWALRYDGTNAAPFQRLTGETGIAAFGIDPRNGDILLANQGLDLLRRLVYSAVSTGAPLPPTLDQSGALADLATLAPQPGVVPYDLNVPFWSDNALKTRWFSVPDTNLTIGFDRNGNWSFPTGTVWIKHFELELTNGVPASRQRLETRLWVKNTTGGYGVTYRWGNSTTNAAPVPEEGLDESFVINEGGGILRTQVWHYPSRQECNLCHTPAGGFALGFNTAQLNRDFDYGTAITNQILALSRAGYFHTNVTGIHTLVALAPPTNIAASLEYRVRSFLAANCVQCHQPGGVPQSLWDARFDTPTAAAGLIDGPLVDDLGTTSNRVIKPGSIINSVLLGRISTLGAGRMPPLASTVHDTNAIHLLSAWITNDLPAYQSFADWQTVRFGSTNAPNAAPEADPDSDRALNYLEYLTGTDPWLPSSAWSIAAQPSGNAIQIIYPQLANRGFEIQATTNLFNPAAWTPLDVPANAPFFSAANRTAIVTDATLTATNKYYRARVFAP